MTYRLVISFSGGRTSAYMTKRLLDIAASKMDPPDVVVVFCNTGLEDERTLEFVHRCDQNLAFKTVWLEAVTPPERGEGVQAKVVTFETAARLGEPFEGMIAKHGIPNAVQPRCTRELKQYPLRAYLRGLGWKRGSYDTAIGIRADEADRISMNAKRDRIIYPMVSWGVRKADVLSWWSQQTFDLNIPEHRGNCVTCWKKSLRKLLTIAKDDPAAFDFMDRMEREHEFTKPGKTGEPWRFFRENRTAQEIIALSRLPFAPYTPSTELQIEMDMLDLGGGCGDSCEVFADEMGDAA